MKIVQIIQYSYSYPISGGDLRNDAILSSLSFLGDVTQIATDSILNGTEKWHRAELEETLAKVIAQTPDLVVIEDVALLEYARALRRSHQSIKIIVDFHNVESALLREQDRSRLPKWLRGFSPFIFRKKWRISEGLDHEALLLADAVWLCSKLDKKLAQTLVHNPVNIAVVPNTVPDWCDGFSGPAKRPNLQKTKILYLGHLGYPPNKRAVRSLVEHVMPAIFTQIPGARLFVAGRSPGKRFRKLLSRFMFAELIADPPELHPLYSAADMVILPITEGGGSRIKVLEALAVGCPIIATAKAVEGIDVVDGHHFLLAETPDEFSKAVVRLIDEPNLVEDMCRVGREFVRSKHSKQALLDSIRASVTALNIKSTARTMGVPPQLEACPSRKFDA